MAPGASVLLMYHRVSLDGSLPEEGDYALPAPVFEEQVRWIAQYGPTVVPLRELTADEPGSYSLVLTFDDGCETDATVAAPLLSALGLSASFFVNPDTIDQPGFLTWDQLRHLVGLGFEVGSHGLAHRLFADLTDEDLTHELSMSKNVLEGSLDCPIESLSLPGGSGGQRTLEAAREAGYRRVLGSRPGVVRRGHAPGILPRYAVRRGHTLATFQRMARGNLMTRSHRSVRYLIATATRAVVGIPRYERLRAARLASRSQAHRADR